MPRTWTMLTPLLLGLWLSPAESRAQGDVAYGAYLATECVTCHRADAEHGAIPPLNGLPVEYLVYALKAYRSGERSNQVMVSVSQALGDAEIEALAAYFATVD